MTLSSFAFSVALLLAGTAAAAAEPDGLTISFPKAAGEAEFAGVPIEAGRGRCRVTEPTGNAVSDAFACNSGPEQRTKVDGRLYAMTWLPPAFQGRFVPAARVPEEPASKPRRKIPMLGKRDVATFWLIIRAEIDKEGRVAQCGVESSSGNADRDRTVCTQEIKSRYLPATLDGVPVEEVRYHLAQIRRVSFITTEPLR